MPAIYCGFGSADELTRYGPTIAVEIGFDPDFQPGGGRHPNLPPARLPALVDTGAIETCIDAELALSLNLPLVGSAQQVAGIGGTIDVNEYMAQIYIPELRFTILGPFPGVHLAAGGQPHYALIGRTFLRRFNMNYEGRTGAVVVSNE